MHNNNDHTYNNMHKTNVIYFQNFPLFLICKALNIFTFQVSPMHEKMKNEANILILEKSHSMTF